MSAMDTKDVSIVSMSLSAITAITRRTVPLLCFSARSACTKRCTADTRASIESGLCATSSITGTLVCLSSVSSCLPGGFTEASIAAVSTKSTSVPALASACSAVDTFIGKTAVAAGNVAHIPRLSGATPYHCIPSDCSLV